MMGKGSPASTERTIAVVFPNWEKDHAEFGQHYSFHHFESVVRRIGEICAVVEVETIGTVLMSARGPSRYFGGDNEVAEKLFELCHSKSDSLHSVVGVGVARSRFAALAAAHLSAMHCSPCVVDDDYTLDFLDALSVQALSTLGNIDDGIVDLLVRLGMRTCGNVRALGEAALIDRFGISGHHIFQRVSAHDVHSFAVDIATSDMSCVYESDTPLTSAQHVVAPLRSVAGNFLDQISSRGQQCTRAYIHCETDHGESLSRIWGEPHGFTVSSLLHRLSYQLEAWSGHAHHNVDAALASDVDINQPTSGVVRVVLTPVECRKVTTTQAVLWGGTEENTERAVRAMSQVVSVADDVRVTVPRWEGGRDVVTAYSQVPLAVVDITSSHDCSVRVGALSQHTKKWTGQLPAPWPAWIPKDPLDVSVTDVNGCHVGATGRHELTGVPASIVVMGKKYDVVRVGGPWPVEERWWDHRRARRNMRAQLLVRDQHNVMRVFLVMLEKNSWKLVGRYD